MSPWKVILATLVIFTAGLVAGGLAVKQLLVRQPAVKAPLPPMVPSWLRDEYVRNMAVELNLTAEQREKISKAVHESQERIRILSDLIGPEMRDELREARAAIRAELTPAQAQQFEVLLKKRQRMQARPGFPPQDNLAPMDGPRRGPGGRLPGNASSPAFP